ncbi:MAG: chromosomal replication initiator protein DnaA [Planctomycetota bacterium]
MTTHDTEIVTALQATLATQLGPPRYELWFGSGTSLEVSEEGISVGVATTFLLEQIRKRFRHQIERACHVVLGYPATVEFRILDARQTHGLSKSNVGACTVEHPPAIAASGREDEHAFLGLRTGHRQTGEALPVHPPGAVSSTDAAAREVESPIVGASAAVHGLVRQALRSEKSSQRERSEGKSSMSTVPGPSGFSSARAPAGRPATCGEENGRSTGRRRFASLDDFVEGQANRLPLSSAERAVASPGQYTPILYHGPTGVGKTHLLEGIWCAARRGPQRRSAVYLSAEQFTSYFIEALRGAGLPSFRRKYRGVELLLIDDLQFFVGKRATQFELLYTIDTLLREGRQLVFSSDRPPDQLAELGPEMITRLQSGLMCAVEPPDYEARREIASRMAHRMGLVLPDDVRDFVATRFACHARAISGALCRLQATVEALGGGLTLTSAENALSDMLRHHEPVVRLADIEKAVCEVFELQSTSLQSSEKGQRVSHPRMLAMWLARKHTRAALGEIGRHFGRRSHSTVISAQKRVDGWLSEQRLLKMADRHCSAEEAVRQIERRLAAG